MGQAKNKIKQCPVTGGKISPRECGENRMSTYDCPESCPQNPWSPENYDRFREIDHKTREKTLNRYHEEELKLYGHVHTPPNGETTFAATLFFLNRLYREKDSNGLTFADRWRAEGLGGLNNDQQQMLIEEENTVVALLEVQQIIDDRRAIVIDLLAEKPEPKLLIDCAFAMTACRFSTLLTLIAESPFFFRLHTAGVPFPEITGLSPVEILTTIVRHQKGPKTREAMLQWLFKNLPTVVESFSAIQTARHAESFRTMDAAYSKTEYKLCGSREELIERLDGVENIHREDPPEENAAEGFVVEWVWTESSNLFDAGRAVLGRVLLHKKDRIRLETTSAKKRDSLRPQLEELLNGQIKFTKQRTDDLSKQMLNRENLQYDKSLVPKKLLKNPMQIENSCTCLPPGHENFSHAEMEKSMLKDFDRTFLDSPLPALNDKTPREAASLPALRPALIQLMKQHIRTRDEHNLRNGSQIDINPIIRELGLDEIDFPPPPERAIPQRTNEEDFEEDAEGCTPCLTSEEVKKRTADLNSSENLRKLFKEAFPDVVTVIDSFLFDAGKIPMTMRELILDLAAQTAFIMFNSDLPDLPKIYGSNLMQTMLDRVRNERRKSDDSPVEMEEPELMRFVNKKLQNLPIPDKDVALVIIFFMAFTDELHHAMLELLEQFLNEHPDLFE